jgi:hypothetical protein
VTTSRGFLAAGAAAGPVYVCVGLLQVLTREGFDVRLHALSLLSNGDLGWIQVANFLVTGGLVIAGALGVRKVLPGQRAGTWGPILLGIYGLGLLGAGVFPADPGQGFPPGTPTPSTSMSSNGLMHFVFGGVGFYALIGACLVFARRFSSTGERGWAVSSVLMGLGFLIAFGAIASGPASPAVMLAFYAAVIATWVWHSALTFKLLKALPHSMVPTAE